MMLISLFPALASASQPRYCLPVTANSVIGFRSPNNPRRTSAALLTAGAFLCPLYCYGGCVWEAVRSAGALGYRSANPRTAATLNRFAAVRGSSTIQGATPMTTLPIPVAAQINRARAAAHKAMAYAALRSNSSLNVRLNRYNNHMNKARAIAGGAL